MRLARTIVGTLIALAVATPLRAAPFVLPATLTDVRGAPVDVAALAAAHRLFVVTLKATWCPVCQEQLRRLGRLLPRLRACGASFIVLAPGPAAALAAIARDTSFPYPFVADEGLVLARAAGLALDDDEIAPAIVGVDATRAIDWVQRGRGAGAFGDGALLAHLGCGKPDGRDQIARAALSGR
jgi:peroxiredoxin